MALLERRSLAPERWESLLELDQVVDRVRRMLDETFSTIVPPALTTGLWSPLVDIEETEDAYVVEADLPGVKREDVDVEVIGNELVIRGEVKERERAGIVRKRARRVGRFEFRATLPDVDADKIEATLSEGVLTVRAPKVEQAKRRKIPIKAA
ncbi:MAG: heat-shock protein Hsp20 [Thermoleophilia bacterium]